MRLTDFEALVRRLSGEVPPGFFEGVAEVTVSPRALPHPVRAEIYTLGECIPLPLGASAGIEGIQSRIVLYHGSFVAVARLQDGFDWRSEAWETLTHELRHHLEWRAGAPELEALDQAAEQNFARQDGDPFDPLFYLDGEKVAPEVYKIDDDYFLDRLVRGRVPPAELTFGWHGGGYRTQVPAEARLPSFLTVEGVAEPPPGELVIALRRKPGLLDLVHRTEPFQAAVTAEPAPREA